jgi:iron complex outermembrane receptor protein
MQSFTSFRVRAAARAFLFSLLASIVFVPHARAAAPFRGVVRDLAGHPVAGATITAERGIETISAADGSFAIAATAQTRLTITHGGFQPELITVDGDRIDVTLRPALAESIVVSGIRADATTPITRSNVERAQIEERYYGQDVPLLLRDTPSINAYAEAGNGGSGYSYVTLRGLSATRLNTTLDGVPLADSEDYGVYFADFPDLARSLQSIQIQRGVGTSSVGAPSFGGSINMQSIDLAAHTETTAEIGAGSYGTKLATIGYQSGLLPHGFAFYSRLSLDQSNGFRDSSSVRQRSFFLSAAKQNEHSQWKLTGFSGHEHSQLAFVAADEATLRDDLRANPLSAPDRDSFGYDLAQLQYLRALANGANMTASVFYQRGYGAYRLFDDEATQSGLRQYALDGLLLGGMVTYSRAAGPWTTNYGVHVNEFRRDHVRDLIIDGEQASRDYANYGTKGEANAFARIAYDSGRVHLYGDGQLRYTDFHYHGDVAIAPIHWTFFNPKLGARFDLNGNSSVYGSAGLSTREPSRNDLFQGEDNASFAHDLHAVRPEHLLDFEAGWDHHTANVTLTANVYAMEFHDEIASTGEYSDIGLLLRRNVSRSYRRGIELESAWQATSSLRLRTAANVSRNRIREWTQFYDVYEADGTLSGSETRTFRNVEPVLTPRVLISQSIDYTTRAGVGAGLTGRWVGRTYLDNTNDGRFTTPSFFDLDANLSFSLARWIPRGAPKLDVQLNNLLDSHRLFPSGYSYIYLQRERSGTQSVEGTSYFYPLATRNAMVRLSFRM